MNRKYLKDIGLKLEDIPEGFCFEEALDVSRGRGKEWAIEREEYGFDSREIWSLDYTIKLYLYERLSMYKEKLYLVEDELKNIRKIEFNNKEYSHIDIIDEILEGLRLDFTIGEHDMIRISDIDIYNKLNNVLYLLELCLQDIEYIGINMGLASRNLKIDYEKENLEYGFNQKEVWFLVKNLKEFIYKRLKMYDDVTDGFLIKDGDFHAFEYKEEILTFQDYIDKILEGLELDMNCSDLEKANNPDIKTKIDDVFKLLPLCFGHLWW